MSAAERPPDQGGAAEPAGPGMDGDRLLRLRRAAAAYELLMGSVATPYHPNEEDGGLIERCRRVIEDAAIRANKRPQDERPPDETPAG